MLASAGILAMALAAGSANAQQATGGSASPAAAPDAAAPAQGKVEEIVVTAQKRAENIQNVPLSIVAVSGQTLTNANVGDPVALQKLVPSLTITSVTYASGAAIRIRGFGTAGNTAVDSDVAAYMDGAFIARPGAALNTFLDVSSVEVLNGPQGTLFGRNAAMGAISINTNAPSTSKMALSGSGELATHNTFSGQAIANLPVSDTFAVRFAGKAAHSGAIYHNDLDGRGYGKNDSYLARVSSKWNITPKFDWTVRADYSNTSGDGVIPNAVFTNSASPAQIAALNAFTTNNGGTPPIENRPPSFEFNQVFGRPYLRDRQYGITSDLSYALSPKLTVRLIDTYRNWKDHQRTLDTLQTSIDVLNFVLDTSSKSQSHELQLVSSKGAFLNNKLGVTAGLYYFKEDFDLNTTFNLGSRYCALVLPAIGGAARIPACLAGPQTAAGYNLFNQTVNSYAAYAQLNYQILDGLEADVGARRTWDRKSASYNAFTPNAAAVNGALIGAESTPLSFRDNNWSYRGTLSYHLTDRTMLFGTYSTGYKSGGFNSGAAPAVLGAANRTFNSEKVRDLELGAKSVFLDGKAQLNATFFNTILKGFQDRSYNGLTFITRNAGDVRSRGVDISGQFRPIRQLNLTSSATYLDSIYKTNTGAPGLEGGAGAVGCPTVQDLSGRDIGYAPHWKVNGQAEYSIPLPAGYGVTIAISGHYSSSFYTLNTLNPQSKLPGFYTGDFRIGFTAPGGMWGVDIFGTNVFDKHYLVALNPQTLANIMPGVLNRTTGATIFRGPLGDPSRFGVRLSGKF